MDPTTNHARTCDVLAMSELVAASDRRDEPHEAHTLVWPRPLRGGVPPLAWRCWLHLVVIVAAVATVGMLPDRAPVTPGPS